MCSLKMWNLSNVQKNPEQSIAGFDIGIIVVEETGLLLQGNIANARSFRFPVLYEVLEGVRSSNVMKGDPAIGEKVIAGGRKLVKRGARVVFGACGSFAYYQKQLAAVLPVPTFLSVMMQVPLILSSLAPDQKLGVIAASAAALAPKVFDQCNILNPGRLVIDDTDTLVSFQQMCNCDPKFNPTQLADDLVHLANKMVESHPEIGALLLQCSDLPPFAAAIQNAVQLPIFDMTTLVEWGAMSVMRFPYD